MIHLIPSERLKITLLFSEGSPTGERSLRCRAVAATPLGLVVDDIEDVHGEEEQIYRERVPAPAGPRLLMLHTIANVEFLDRATEKPFPFGAGEEQQVEAPYSWKEENLRTDYGKRANFSPEQEERAREIEAGLRGGQRRRREEYRDFVAEEGDVQAHLYLDGSGTETRIVDNRAPLGRDATAAERAMRSVQDTFLQDHLIPELDRMRKRLSGE